VRRHSVVAAVTAAVIFAPASAFPAADKPPATMSWTEHGRGVAQEETSLQLQAGKSLVVQTHVLEPGFRAPWHHHPDSSWVVIMRGELTVWLSCTDRRVWKAGGVYFNPPTEKAVNEGTEPVELVVIYANVPAEQPAGTIPFTPAVPPAGCPL
jgi:quercetin dioxygenase-like cupin family protein